MKNPITIEELQELINNENKNAEALEFYFEYVSNGPFAGEYQLKSHIQIVKNYDYQTTGEKEGAPLINIVEKLLNDANRIARKKRDKLFNERVSDPNKIIVVTEGDSWFQYPKYKKLGITISKEVKDIIDYIIEDSRFAVKSLDAAADVIRNMFHKSEYLDAVKLYNPSFFILSGGGNDFFEVFPDMIQKGNTDDIKTFLKESWLTELEVIKTYYEGMLKILTSTFPNLEIILHGYDYIMPQPDGKWIGKPMIEKGGLNSSNYRKKLITFIMDKFNQVISEVSENHEKVHFIDLRNTVPQDAQFWHDEIHPNDHGFRLIADKFISKVDELIVSL